MKALLRSILINLLVFYLCSIIYPGFSIRHDFKVLVSAAVVWFFLNKFVKPIIKLLLLPINLITLNLFAWTISLLTLFLLQIIVGDISITAYNFPGVNYQGFTIPPIYINTFFSFLITSTLLNTLLSSIKWLIRKEE
ncbi:MAG TPA: phage holin family protein [Patescibacteria group bacterium]